MSSAVRSRQQGGGSLSPQTTTFKESRACPRCGHIRKTVTSNNGGIYPCRECKAVLRLEAEQEAWRK